MNNKIKLLKKIETLYLNQNENIANYLKKHFGRGGDNLEDILISYDIQAGNYTEIYESQMEWREKIVSRLADVIRNLNCYQYSIFECGVGEATTLVPLLNQLGKEFSFSGGVDISWSRIKFGQKFADKYCKITKPLLIMGDMLRLPLLDSSIDIVYTFHSIEPNQGKEKEILQELYRITNEYLVLVEPSYDMANEEQKKYMEQNGYIKNLYGSVKELGYEIEIYEPYGFTPRPLNPTWLMVIKKGAHKKVTSSPLCCPATRTPIRQIENAYFSEESLLGYPILNGVPCLIESSAIVATKLDLFEEK